MSMEKKKVSLNVEPSTRDLVKIIIALRRIPIYEWIRLKAEEDWAYLQEEMKNKLYGNSFS